MQEDVHRPGANESEASIRAEQPALEADVDFCKDLKATILQWMSDYGIRFKKNDELRNLLIKYFTFREKYVEPRKRSVYVSKEIIEKLPILPQFTQEALDKLKEWVQQGVDINCFQGRGLCGDGSRDYQNMLYGIVHLHLSARANDVLPRKRKDGFSKRAEYLLFALFKDDAAYFLDAIPHPETLSPNNPDTEEWTSSRYIQIIENNWPQLLNATRLPITALCDGAGNPIKLSDQDIAHLTVNHTGTAIEGNHGIYILGLGSTGFGDSMKAAMSAQKLINRAIQCQLIYGKDRTKIHSLFSTMLCDVGKSVPDNFDIHYDYIPDLRKWVVLDRISGAALDMTDGSGYLFPVGTD